MKSGHILRGFCRQFLISSFFGHKTYEMGSNFKHIGYLDAANLKDIPIDIPIATRPVWWPPSPSYSPPWTETWS